MRTPLVPLLAFLFFPNLMLAADVEYGHLKELKGVERVNVWTDKDPALRADVERRLKEALPALTIVETEQEAQIVLAVKRRTAREDSPDPNLRYVTTGSVMRQITPTRVRLLIDLVSTKENLAEATAELTGAFINHLKAQNVKKYGRPDATAKIDKRQFRSLAGLRPGLSKKEVLAAVGPPSRMEGKGFTTTFWFYDTTDGTFRIIFQGDALMNAQLIESKKK